MAYESYIRIGISNLEKMRDSMYNWYVFEKAETEASEAAETKLTLHDIVLHSVQNMKVYF